ncbi:MAG: lipocalin family protein [Gemmatimonadota bacterium]|nr:lipocalin family protein [Gemmatimonadota bacterium]
MRMRSLCRLTAGALAVAVLPLTLGCGDDAGPNGTTIVASWVATSLTAPSQPGWGDAISDDGVSVNLTFTATGTYTFSVANDDPADPWICPNQATCSWNGTYATSGNTLTFDQGTADEMSATFSLSGNNLTVTFSASAQIVDPYRYVFQKTT